MRKYFKDRPSLDHSCKVWLYHDLLLSGNIVYISINLNLFIHCGGHMRYHAFLWTVKSSLRNRSFLQSFGTSGSVVSRIFFIFTTSWKFYSLVAILDILPSNTMKNLFWAIDNSSCQVLLQMSQWYLRSKLKS